MFNASKIPYFYCCIPTDSEPYIFPPMSCEKKNMWSCHKMLTRHRRCLFFWKDS